MYSKNHSAIVVLSVLNISDFNMANGNFIKSRNIFILP